MNSLKTHLALLKRCAKCPQMCSRPVTPRPVRSEVYLVGQAPGVHEYELGRPFAWTAGKTLFRWFAQLGVSEETLRSRVYISAVCRCFPGKAAGGGDRVPSAEEIAACAFWMRREIELLRPKLIIPVGRLAIERFIARGPLTALVGQQHRSQAFNHPCDVIPLPHPSGASTWFKMEPGRPLLKKALQLVARHPAWRAGTPIS